jgi:hypothetical protein
MAKTYDIDYDSIQSKINEKTKQQQAEYEAKRKQAAEDYINRYNQAADIASKPVIEGYEQDIAKVPQQYAAGFNANAVQERINAKNVAERMANMGMTDSGLNRTQQTALTLQRGNADARLREQQQNAIDELTRALNEYRAQQSANKLQNAGNIYQQADVDTANNLTSLYNSARDTATNLYGTNVSANTAQEQMAQEAAIAQAERELQERLQAQKLQQEAAIAQAERELQQQLQKEQLEHERGQNTLDRAMNKWIATHSGSSSSGESDVVQSYWMNAYKALLSQGASSEEAMAQADSIVDRLFGSGTSSGSSAGSGSSTGSSGSSSEGSGQSVSTIPGGSWSNNQTLMEAAGLSGNDYTTQMRILYQGGRVNDQDALDSIFGHAYEEQALSGGNSFTAMNNALSIAKAIGIPDSAIQSYQASAGLKWDSVFNS